MFYSFCLLSLTVASFPCRQALNPTSGVCTYCLAYCCSLCFPGAYLKRIHFWRQRLPFPVTLKITSGETLVVGSWLYVGHTEGNPQSRSVKNWGDWSLGFLLRALPSFLHADRCLGKWQVICQKNFWTCALITISFQHPFKGRRKDCSPRTLSDSLLRGWLHPPFVGTLCPPKPPFPPFRPSPLSRPLHGGSSTASCKSPLLGHASVPKSKARVYALYSCLMSRERGLSGGKL